MANNLTKTSEILKNAIMQASTTRLRGALKNNGEVLTTVGRKSIKGPKFSKRFKGLAWAELLKRRYGK